jgi:hypothetical protein
VAGLHASGLAVWVRQPDQLRTALVTALSAPGGRAADLLGQGIDPATWITHAITPAARRVLSP